MKHTIINDLINLRVLMIKRRNERMKSTQKRKLTLAQSWRAEMEENIKEAYYELNQWLKQEMETRTNLELERAELKIRDSIRIAAFANKTEGVQLMNYLEESLQEDVE